MYRWPRLASWGSAPVPRTAQRQVVVVFPQPRYDSRRESFPRRKTRPLHRRARRLGLALFLGVEPLQERLARRRLVEDRFRQVFRQRQRQFRQRRLHRRRQVAVGDQRPPRRHRRREHQQRRQQQAGGRALGQRPGVDPQTGRRRRLVGVLRQRRGAKGWRRHQQLVEVPRRFGRCRCQGAVSRYHPGPFQNETPAAVFVDNVGLKLGENHVGITNVGGMRS